MNYNWFLLGIMLSVVPYPPIYYKETPFGYEQLDSLPTVTVYDTVYLAEINTIVKDINELQALIDSLAGLSGERLYYNFFLRNDSLSTMSESFIVKELGVNDELIPRALARREPENGIDPAARREILFRIDDSDRTARFIQNKTAIRKAISHLFTEMQSDSIGIRGVDLYFPDYDFTHRRDMVQFVKSVRIMMDASRDFKFESGAPVPMPLYVFFNADPDRDKIPKDFIYSLGQEASSVVFFDNTAPENFYVRAKEFTAADWEGTGLLLRIRSHLSIARYYTEELDIIGQQITDFSEANIQDIIEADYSENHWETFMFILIALLAVSLVFLVLYRGNAALSLFVSHHTESVLLVLMVVVLEMGILLVTAFENMCEDDGFTLIEQHPLVIFLLPLGVVLAAPLLHHILKNRKTP